MYDECVGVVGDEGVCCIEMDDFVGVFCLFGVVLNVCDDVVVCFEFDLSDLFEVDGVLCSM